jgi:hypothetical protein
MNGHGKTATGSHTLRIIVTVMITGVNHRVRRFLFAKVMKTEVPTIGAPCRAT